MRYKRAALFLLCGLIWMGVGCSRLPIQTNNVDSESAKQIDCTGRGMAAVRSYKADNKTDVTGSPLFHYNKNLGKCMAFLEVAPYIECESARVIFDVDENKELLTSSYCGGENRYVDSSKYPPEMIDAPEYVIRKNQMLELDKN